jgi:hypothetical protein
MRPGDQRIAKAIGLFEHKPKGRTQQPRRRTHERRQEGQHEETARPFSLSGVRVGLRVHQWSELN